MREHATEGEVCSLGESTCVCCSLLSSLLLLSLWPTTPRNSPHQHHNPTNTQKDTHRDVHRPPPPTPSPPHLPAPAPLPPPNPTRSTDTSPRSNRPWLRDTAAAARRRSLGMKRRVEEEEVRQESGEGRTGRKAILAQQVFNVYYAGFFTRRRRKVKKISFYFVKCVFCSKKETFIAKLCPFFCPSFSSSILRLSETRTLELRFVIQCIFTFCARKDPRKKSLMLT